MASFEQTQGPKFSTYTPQVGAETYGKMLAKKEEDYLTGAKKVQATIDQVAGLPVLTSAEKDYLSGKIKGITTDINQKVGTDFSNLNQVNTISGHINSIANDPIIQRAVQNVYTARAGNDKQKVNQETNPGKTIANDWKWEQQLSNFLTYSKPGDAFGGEYHDYTDVDQWGDKVMSKVHPEWRKIDSPAQDYVDPNTGQVIHAYQQYNKVTNAWEEIPIAKIKEVLEEGIKNSPEIASQMSINAEYLMKEMQLTDYLQSKRKTINIQLDLNNQYINYYKNIISGVEPIPEDIFYNISSETGWGPELVRKHLESKVSEIEGASTLLKNYDYTQDILDWENPERNQAIKNRLYKESWIQQKVDQYGGKRKQEFLLEGDPVARELSQREFDWKTKKDLWDMHDKEILRNLEAQKAALEREKFEWEKTIKGGGQPLHVVQPTDFSKMTPAWNDLTQKADDGEKQVRSELYQFIANTPEGKNLFTTQYDENNNPFLVLKADGRKTSDGRDLNELVLDKLFDKYTHTRKIGNITIADPDGAKIPLSNSKIAAINKIMADQKSLKTYKDAIKEGNTQLAASGNDPVTNFFNSIDQNLHNINTKYQTNFTKKDINNFVNALGTYSGDRITGNSLEIDLEQAMGKLGANARDPRGQGNQFILQEYINKYGPQFVDWIKMRTLPELADVIFPSTGDLEKRATFLNNYANRTRLIPQIQEKVLTTGETKLDDRTMNDVVNILAQIPGGIKKYPIAQAVLTGKTQKGDERNKGIGISTFWKGGKAYMRLIDVQKDPSATGDIIPIPDALVPSLGKNIDPKISSGNLNNSITVALLGPTKSNFTDNQPNWSDAYTIDKDNNGLETRVGFEWDPSSNQWYRFIYQGHSIKDAKPKDDGVPVGDNAEVLGKWVEDQMIKNSTISYLK